MIESLGLGLGLRFSFTVRVRVRVKVNLVAGVPALIESVNVTLVDTGPRLWQGSGVRVRVWE